MLVLSRSLVEELLDLDALLDALAAAHAELSGGKASLVPRVGAFSEDGVLGTMLRVEREEEDPLPLPEAENPIRERNLLRPRPEEEGEQALARAQLPGHDALEQLLEVLEEARFPLLHAHEGERARAVEVGNARADAGPGDLARDVVRDVHYRERREGCCDRNRELDARHARATSFGRRKWTSSFATVISSGNA